MAQAPSPINVSHHSLAHLLLLHPHRPVQLSPRSFFVPATLLSIHQPHGFPQRCSLCEPFLPSSKADRDLLSLLFLNGHPTYNLLPGTHTCHIHFNISTPSNTVSLYRHANPQPNVDRHAAALSHHLSSSIAYLLPMVTYDLLRLLSVVNSFCSWRVCTHIPWLARQS
jgi:hypothetical protein